MVSVTTCHSIVTEVEQIGAFDDEYVYDIGVDDETPYFFANDILVHNSSYFSAIDLLRNELKDVWTREDVIHLYDAIADETNSSFPDFMDTQFNTGLERGGIIRAARELVASKGYFIRKKKYSVLMYDKEGMRLDTDGKPGKLKTMGLDLKRSDTPKFVQGFLERLLLELLMGAERRAIIESIKEFRQQFTTRPGWEKGTPKKVNGLSAYQQKQTAAAARLTTVMNGEHKRVDVPWHVQAALNWNKLRRHFNDPYSMDIGDGTKTIVCRLKPNPFKMKHVAYPIDEPHLPKWFKELPFDHGEMENAIIDKKLDNLLGVLQWDLQETQGSLINDFISFG